MKTSHPSPLSSYRGFIGSKIYTQVNDYLISKNIEEIKSVIAKFKSEALKKYKNLCG